MGMYHGMDLSAFKKVKSDDKTTTLRHAKGHEIRIAHKSLTPKLKGMLDGLQMFADNKNGVQDPEAMDPDSPATADDTPSAPEFEGSVAPATSQEFQSAPTADPDDGPPPGNLWMQDAQNPADYKPMIPNVLDQFPADSGNQVTLTGSRATTPDDVQQENNNQKYDINQGHIDPKTLGDLFADRSVPGKIGMLIGMMMSGAGSGLAHQPDKYMGLINDQLNRDFEAQKSSAANQQNFLKLSQENELRKANIEHTQADTKNLGQMYGKMLMNNLTDYRINNTAHLLPPGGAAQVAPILGLSAQNFQNQNNQAMTEGLGKIGLDHLGDPAKAPDDSGVDLNKITHLQNAANFVTQNPKISLQEGVPSQDDMQHINDEASKISTNRYIAKIYHSAFNDLDTTFAGQGGEAADSGLSVISGLAKRVAALVPAGTPAAKVSEILSQASPGDAELFQKFDQYRKAKMADVVARMTNQATGGNSTLAQANDIAEGLFPNIWDLSNDQTRAAKLKAGDDALESAESGALYSKRFGTITKFPRATYNAKPRAPAAADSTDPSGYDAPAGLTGGMTPAQLQNKMRGVK